MYRQTRREYDGDRSAMVKIAELVKIWLQFNREGISVARCTVERLMRAAG